MLEQPEENRLDQSLRDLFSDYELNPTPLVWAGIRQRLAALPPPAPDRPRRFLPLPLLLLLTALVGGLGGWLLPSLNSDSVKSSTEVVKSSTNSARSSTEVANLNTDLAKSNTELTTTNTSIASPSTEMPNPNKEEANLSTGIANLSTGMANLNINSPKSKRATGKSNPEPQRGRLSMAIPATQAAVATAATAEEAVDQPTFDQVSAPTDELPASLRPLVALERQTLEQLPAVPAGRTRLVSTLHAERAELQHLQRRIDSLLLALDDTSSEAVAAALAAATNPAADTTRPPATPRHRWVLALGVTPEQNALSLKGAENNTLTAARQGHETGRAGLNAALTAEYALTPRLSVGGGLGYSTYGADVRLTAHRTDVDVKYDTTTTNTTTYYTSTNMVYAIRILQIPQLSPVFNASGQVVSYDTVYIPRPDTVRTTIVQNDAVNTTSKTVTPLISKREVTTTTLLRPTYRFLTLPVLLRYRLTPGQGRWWTDVAVGAQLQFFLGGTQVVSTDGQTYRTEQVGAGGGPFRALNVALSGSLALNYALSNRLSVSVAPSMRWQALSLYKTETGLRQQPTATGLQLGVRFKL